MKIERIVRTLGSEQEITALQTQIDSAPYPKTNPYGAILNKNLTQELTKKLEELKQTSTIAVVTAGRAVYEFSVDSEVTDEELKSEVKNAIQDSRKEARTIVPQTTSFNGIQYQTTGGVFTEVGALTKIKQSINPVQRATASKAPHPKIRADYVGFEIEYISKANGGKTREDFAAAKLDGFVTCKGDGSLRADNDGEHCHEVTVLCKQSDMVAIMSRVLAVIKSHGGYVNNSCGGHIHLDARGHDPKLMYSNLVAGLPLLNSLIPKKRINNRFCQTNHPSRDYDYYTNGEGSGTKYWAINPQTYSRIKTIEVRMHGGTLNLAKWVNWVKICAALAYSKDKLSQVSTLAEFMVIYTGQDAADLSAFIEKRQHLIQKTADDLDTRTDHFLDIYNAIA